MKILSLKPFLIPISILFSLLLLSSCDGGDDNEVPAGNIDKTKLLSLVNDLRQKGCNCGTEAMPAVGKLTWNDILEKAAVKHSTDMETNNFFDHTSSDGTTFSARITAAGYSGTIWGENIAKGYTTEQEVFNGWFGSAGHCKNMMDSRFKDIGVGKSGIYWTMDLGSK
jgi:uncharacterized protein YkwD